MVRRAFQAMGTEVELLLDAEPGERRSARSTGPRPSSSGSSR